MTELAMHPELAAHGGFGHLRLGRIKPTEEPKLMFAPYVAETFTPPAEVDHYSAVNSWPMYGNDQLGDCTWATVGHLVQAWTAMAGTLRTPAASDIVQGYWETGDPPSASGQAGDPTDDGRMETAVLTYWRHVGIPNENDKIVAYAKVDHTQMPRVQEAVALLGGVYIGIAMPVTAESQSIWDYVPDTPDNEPGSWGGHAVPVVGYDSEYLYVVTWGAVMKMTYAFWQHYVDETYAVVSPDTASLGAGGSVDVAALEADVAALTSGAAGGDLPPDAVVPTPTPDPAPEPASEPETPPETASSTIWTATLTQRGSMGVEAATEDEAREKVLAEIAARPDLIVVTQAPEATT